MGRALSPCAPGPFSLWRLKVRCIHGRATPVRPGQWHLRCSFPPVTAQEHFRSVPPLDRGVEDKYLAEIANVRRTAMKLSGEGLRMQRAAKRDVHAVPGMCCSRNSKVHGRD